MASGLVEVAAGTAAVGLTAYAVLGGADFGGGVWDALARGPRRERQRAAISEAMGPVWEANHVWLIFVVVVLFSAFPRLFSALFELQGLGLLAVHVDAEPSPYPADAGPTSQAEDRALFQRRLSGEG